MSGGGGGGLGREDKEKKDKKEKRKINKYLRENNQRGTILRSIPHIIGCVVFDSLHSLFSVKIEEKLINHQGCLYSREIER